MNKVLLFFLISIVGGLAHADAGKIKYGRDLCDVVTFRTSTERACEDWVIDNSNRNIYSIALNVCVAFNSGPSSRTAECFTRASQWIPNQDVKDQTELCEHRHGNYNPRAQCLMTLFTRMNVRVNEAQQGQAQSSESAGAVR